MWAVKGASKLLPKIAGKAMKEQVDIDQIIALALDPQASGVLIEIEDHQGKERIVISIVAEDRGPCRSDRSYRLDLAALEVFARGLRQRSVVRSAVLVAAEVVGWLICQDRTLEAERLRDDE
jgi:hypothetical protein